MSIFCYHWTELLTHRPMNDFLPADFNCSNGVYQIAMRKIAELNALADELPVFIIHDVRDFSVVYLSPKGTQQLGVTLKDVRQMGGNYYANFFNTADVEFYVPKCMAALRDPKQPAQWFSFFQQVTTAEDGGFEWYLSASRPFVYDEEGNPLLSLTFALQLDPNHHLAEKAERLMAENLMLKDNYQRFASLTKREKQLLKYIAAGDTAEKICGQFFISDKTLKTHRRNIKKKLGAKTHYDLIRFAQAFNLV